jgi:hypothetical protein
MAVLDVNQKAGVYETLSSLNAAFAGIVQHLQTLQKFGTFKPKSVKLLSGLAQELQAEINQEFLEDLHQLELDDWGSYGKARQKWEKHVRDPDDVFIHAEERRRELAKQRPLKKSKALRSRPVTARQSKQSSPHFAARRLRKR